MKLAILTDTHAGVRNDSDFYNDVQADFYDNMFFPTCLDRGVTSVLHLGDMMDKRKTTNAKSLHILKNHFINRVLFYEMDFHIVLGNHDIFYKNTKEVSSVKEIFGKHVGERFHIYDKPKVVRFGTKEMLLVPWLIPDEMEGFAGILDGFTTAMGDEHKMCAGHFEMNGVLMQKGVLANHGIDPDIFKKFDCVLSGHYHTRSLTGNVIYIGSPFQMTFADLNDEKRFCIYDTETNEFEWIYNNNPVFMSFEYNGQDNIDILDYDQFADMNVKLIVTAKDDVKKYNQFIKFVEEANPYNLIVIDKYLFADASDAEDVDIEQDTLEVLIETADQMETPDEWRQPIKTILTGLYEEANSF